MAVGRAIVLLLCSGTSPRDRYRMPQHISFQAWQVFVMQRTGKSRLNGTSYHKLIFPKGMLGYKAY